ncbi:hypothetical protein V6O07_20035, partial [Arthrospira platensis SPKY2]
MILNRHLHLEGFIKEDCDDDIYLSETKIVEDNRYYSDQETKIACVIAKELTGLDPDLTDDEDEEQWDVLRTTIPKCKIVMYFSNEKE